MAFSANTGILTSDFPCSGWGEEPAGGGSGAGRGGVAKGLRLPGGQRWGGGSWAGLACCWAPAAHAGLPGCLQHPGRGPPSNFLIPA